MVDPPTPVSVDLAIVLTGEARPAATHVSMRAKSASLDSTATVRGLLRAWVRCNSLH
ncbi:hypothetical protein [Nocardia sp. NPDC024068]|uniref:hypothetical protein n=1 Tax=Nocardia sp. NPDC024068 TaxID=3157197 RepID=UPI0033CDBCFE